MLMLFQCLYGPLSTGYKRMGGQTRGGTATNICFQKNVDRHDMIDKAFPRGQQRVTAVNNSYSIQESKEEGFLFYFPVHFCNQSSQFSELRGEKKSMQHTVFISENRSDKQLYLCTILPFTFTFWCFFNFYFPWRC